MNRVDQSGATDSASSEECRCVRRGLWVTFGSDALEAEYWQDCRPLASTLASIYVAVVIAGLAIFAVQDYLTLGWTTDFARLAALRLFLIAFSVATLVRIRGSRSRRTLEWSIVLWALVSVAGHGAIASIRPVDSLLGLVNGRAIVLLGFLMVPSPWAVITPASLLLCAVYAGYIATDATIGAGIVVSNGLYLVVNGLACVWALQNEFANRHRFLALKAETRLRQELDVARAAADRSNRAKSEFLATMSHEIRTPMNGVLGFANLLAETPLTEEQRHYVSTIRGSGETLLAIINDILDFSKIESGQLVLERVPCDLRATVRDVIDLMSVRAEQKRLALSLHVDESVPAAILGDPARLRQVLLNLVGNALKFTDRGQVVVSVSLSGDALRFTVTDTGIGLMPSEIDRLFQRFSQADASTTRRFGGTGLGLAISKRLVESMGGAIGVDSRSGAGSTFWFTLPAAAVPGDVAPDAPVPGTASDRVGENLGRAPRVLVAEDDATSLLLATRLLTSLGCVVDAAGDGGEAIEKWRQQVYDVIFMDCQMPSLDGLAATSEIRRLEAEAARGTRGPAARVWVVACSAGVTRNERQQCYVAGMDDFVSKPLSKNDLRRALQDALSALAPRSAA